MKSYKELPLTGTGFQHLIDSYFWNLPFASVRQCKFVMDRADIPEDEWKAKRDALAAEHNLPTLANSSQKVSRLGCRLICSRIADPRLCLF